MTNLLAFFLILFAAVFFSDLFRRLHLPWVIGLIIAGVIIGPFGFGVFEPNPTISFIGEIGLVFLMFMAGLETHIRGAREFRENVLSLSVLNGLIPFAVGFGVAHLFGYGWPATLLLGVIFISSSIAVVVPSLKASGLLETRIGNAVVSATMVEDVASLVLLSVFLQTFDPITRIPLPFFYLLLFVALILLRWLLPKIRVLFWSGKQEHDVFQQELRAIFLILIGTVVIFELLGLHPIIAGFFAGFVLSSSITSQTLKEKLRAVSYGIFIPVFFVLVGAQTNIGIFQDVAGAFTLALTIAGASIASKFLSGWIGGKIEGFTTQESLLIGSATIPQLSTTLAVVFVAAEIGALDEQMVTAMVFLSILTTLLSPLLVSYFARKIEKPIVQPLEEQET